MKKLLLFLFVSYSVSCSAFAEESSFFAPNGDVPIEFTAGCGLILIFLAVIALVTEPTE